LTDIKNTPAKSCAAQNRILKNAGIRPEMMILQILEQQYENFVIDKLAE
jgi:hypothetical protein